MAGEPERRLQKVMDKLYRYPNKKPTPSRDGLAGGGRRADLCPRFGLEKGLRVASLASSGVLGPPPPCRPWDRGDLLRRLATFKAMTWFAKPKVISPVNCARRGWANIEVDVIGCEACGARLLFSTPSSWTLRQVEKAAAVFSLKLDNGHKSLCSWIDNICDEYLALFPPTPPPALVENYNKCLSFLLRLSALPLISSFAIVYMKRRSPSIEQFLKEPFPSSIGMKGGMELSFALKHKDLDGAFEDASADRYYEALKLISLCGWETRQLPYAVDHVLKSGDAVSFSKSTELIIHHEQENSMTIYPSNGHGILAEKNVLNQVQDDHNYDPASVVLECKFCGACVALWALEMVDRPLQTFNLIADSSTMAEPAKGGVDPRTGNSGLNWTIAGGPPPTRQSYRPRIAFPIVTRHLGAEISSSGKCLSFENWNTWNDRHNSDPVNYQKDRDSDTLNLEAARSQKSKRSRDEILDFECGDNNTQTNFTGRSHGSSTGVCCNSYTEKTKHDVLQTSSCSEKGNTDCQEDVAQIEPDCLNATSTNFKDVDEAETFDKGTGDVDINKVEGRSGATSDVVIADKNTDFNVCDPVGVLEASNEEHGEGVLRFVTFDEIPGNDLGESVSIVSSGKNAAVPSSGREFPETDHANSNFQNAMDTVVKNQKLYGFTKELSSISKESDANLSSGKQMLYGRMNEFDPIKQHRTFCPWIAPENGEAIPGWVLTLQALISQERGRLVLDSNSGEGREANVLDEDDDPIASVRKLFMSPPSKRLKTTG